MNLISTASADERKNRMKARIMIIAAALALTACTGSSSHELSSAPTSETSKPTDDASSDPSNTKKLYIKADALSYYDDVLCFEYEEKEYSIPLDKNRFKNEIPTYGSSEPILSERIINNRNDISIKADLVMDPEMSEIISCDVINENGYIYYGKTPFSNDTTVNRDLLYTMTCKENTLCEISNSKETINCDLNDLPLCMKLDYPDSVFPIMFTAYKYNDGKVMLISINTDVKVSSDGVSSELDLAALDSYGKRTAFFATVQSVDPDRASVLLNDGITLCNVPVCYSDGGSLEPGTKIMLVLTEDDSLFGSGEEKSFDYAVISTEPEKYNRGKKEFSDLAYGEFIDWDILQIKCISDL